MHLNHCPSNYYQFFLIFLLLITRNRADSNSQHEFRFSLKSFEILSCLPEDKMQWSFSDLYITIYYLNEMFSFRKTAHSNTPQQRVAGSVSLWYCWTIPKNNAANMKLLWINFINCIISELIKIMMRFSCDEKIKSMRIKFNSITFFSCQIDQINQSHKNSNITDHCLVAVLYNLFHIPLDVTYINNYAL